MWALGFPETYQAQPLGLNMFEPPLLEQTPSDFSSKEGVGCKIFCAAHDIDLRGILRRAALSSSQLASSLYDFALRLQAGQSCKLRVQGTLPETCLGFCSSDEVTKARKAFGSVPTMQVSTHCQLTSCFVLCWFHSVCTSMWPCPQHHWDHFGGFRCTTHFGTYFSGD